MLVLSANPRSTFAQKKGLLAGSGSLEKEEMILEQLLHARKPEIHVDFPSYLIGRRSLTPDSLQIHTNVGIHLLR